MNNTIENLFITAARKKFRFETNRGGLLTEDLFDLPLSNLDTLALALDDKIQKAGRKSFVVKRSVSDTESEAKLEIVKFVIEAKQTEAEAAKKRAETTSQKAFLKELLQKKQLTQLENLSTEEIEKQIAALG